MKRKLIVGIAAILILGVSGFLFWRERSKENQNSSPTAKTTTTTPDIPDDANGLTDPTEGGKYLLIKEWGVRLPIPESYRSDIEYGVYTIKEPGTGEDPLIVYFASKKLAALSPLCGLEQWNDEFGTGLGGGQFALSRSRNKTDSKDRASSITDGTYWYFPEPSHASCAPNDESAGTIDSMQADFKQSLIQQKFFEGVEKY